LFLSLLDICDKFVLGHIFFHFLSLGLDQFLVRKVKDVRVKCISGLIFILAALFVLSLDTVAKLGLLMQVKAEVEIVITERVENLFSCGFVAGCIESAQ